MEFAEISISLLSFLFFIAIIAGFLDTVAGGGGLISLPALIIAGIPPLAALGTNKLQGSMGTATASYIMLKNNRVKLADIKLLMLAAFIGSTAGTIAVQFIDTEVLSFVIPVVLLFIAVYFLVSPMPDETQRPPRLSNTHYRNFVIPVVGAYDGMFGPGTGSFLSLAGITCRGHGLLTATAIAKPLNFATNIAALIVFIFSGQLVWLVGGLMMAGQLIGAWLGAHSLFKMNPAYLRLLVVLMCSGMLIKYSHSMGWLSLA